MTSAKHSTVENFVVYAFSREVDSETGPKGSYYYIGKGKPNRPYTCSNRKTVKCPRDRKNHIHILHHNLTEQKAFTYEKNLIQFYGRKDTGEGWCVLRNLTDGGEGASGKVMSAAEREKITGKNSPHYIARHWSHTVHGLVASRSISDLLEEYPEDNLLQSGLSLLAGGKIHGYKEWVFIPDGEIDLNMSSEELNKKFGADYAKKKLADNKDRNRGSNNCRYISRDWCHPEHGLVLNTSISELVKKFPQDNLSRSVLGNVAKGTHDHHKQWIFIDKDRIDRSLSREQLNCIFSKEYAKSEIERMREIRKKRRKKPSKTGPSKLRDWYHPEHGIVRQTSGAEIARKYSHPYKLNPSLLYAVACGKRDHHRGWRILLPEVSESPNFNASPRP